MGGRLMGVVLNCKIDEIGLRDKIGRGPAGKLQKQLMAELGAFWHENIMPQHFAANNRFAYRLKSRNDLYLDEIKKEEGQGPGKETLLVLSGKSRRFAMAFVKISGSKTRHTVTMSTPPYFARPFIGTFTTKNGETKQITKQPDKPDEMTQVNGRDRNRMIKFGIQRGTEIIEEGVSHHQTTIKS
jgi:hypothetical protein